MSRLQPDTFYHIFNHANGTEDIFREEKNYCYFLTKWKAHIQSVATTYAYCLMPNHFHALVRIKEVEELMEVFNKKDQTGFQNLSGLLSQQFSNCFNAYAKGFNKTYNRRGSLFNRPFKARPVLSNNYLTNVIFYIHHNPVHHGFTDNMEDWKHSSYHALISDKLTQLPREYITDWFGGREKLKIFHRQAIRDLDVFEKEFT